MSEYLRGIDDLFTGATFTILTLLSSLNSCVNPWIYLAFNRELVRLLTLRICRGRETSSYRGGSGGSGSSTGTPGETGLHKRKSFTKLTNSVIVTKASFTETNSCRRNESSGSRSSVSNVRKGSASGTRRLSEVASSLLVRNSALTVAAATCCRFESEESDIPRNTFRYDTAGPYRGLNRSGAIRKKCNVPSDIENVEDVTKERNYYTDSLMLKKERKTSSGYIMMEDADAAGADAVDQVKALLHGEPEARRQMQAQF